MRRPALLSRKTVRDAKSAQEQKGKKKPTCCVRPRKPVRDAQYANDVVCANGEMNSPLHDRAEKAASSCRTPKGEERVRREWRVAT